jgi:indoleacetamide hydrolase
VRNGPCRARIRAWLTEVDVEQERPHNSRDLVRLFFVGQEAGCGDGLERHRSSELEASERYAEVYRAHGVAAIAFPTIPMVAMPIRQGGPKEPFGEMITLNGQKMEEGKVLMLNLFIAPRMGAAALSVPVGLIRGLPVGLELDALPGHDSELLGLGMAVQKVVGRIPPPRFQ